MKRIDLMGSVMPIDDPALDTSRPAQFPGLMEGGDFAMSAGPGQFRACYIGFREPAENIEVVVRYTITAEARQTRWASMFQVALLDRDYRKRHKIRSDQVRSKDIRARMTHMGVGIERAANDETIIHLNFGQLPSDMDFFATAYQLPDPLEFEVRIVKVGGFVEAQLNGATIALAPVRESTDQHGVFFQVIGARVKVHEVRVSALE